MTLAELGIDYSLSVVTDGEQAVNSTLRRQGFLAASKPDIIFLDMNLPNLSGVEVLEAIQDGNECPLCVVSGSRSEQDYVPNRPNLDARWYVRKPVDRQRILDVFDCLAHLKEHSTDVRTPRAITAMTEISHD